MSSKAALIATKPRDILTKAIEVSTKINSTKRQNNFFEIATLKPRNGVGMNFRQKNWTGLSYYQVTKVNVQPVCVVMHDEIDYVCEMIEFDSLTLLVVICFFVVIVIAIAIAIE